MGRKALVAAALSSLVASLVACGLSDQECLQLREQAFDVVNDQKKDSPHTCADDTDCHPSRWPECAKPVNGKNLDKILAFEDQFKKGRCAEEAATCSDLPLIYCKQGLCVTLHKAGEKGNPHSEP